jgi:MscS family membrane protein
MINAFHAWLLKDFWLAAIILYFLSGGALALLEYLLSYRLRTVYKNKKCYWQMAIAESLHTPAQIYIGLMVFLLSIPKLLEPLGIELASLKGLHTCQELVSAVFALWFFMRLIKRVEASFHSRITDAVGKISDRTQVSAVAKIGRILLIIIFFFMLLPILGIPSAALLTFGGVSTIVIGFATKDTAANLIGGLTIYWDRPFSVGDWICSPDKEIEGIVEDIGWRLTRIRTFDKRPLYVPNAFFSTISIENPGRMSSRRIKANIGVRYSDPSKLPKLLDAVQNMLKNHPDIDQTQTRMVNIVELGPESLNFCVYAFTKTIDFIKFESIQQDVLLKTYDIVREHDADCVAR